MRELLDKERKLINCLIDSVSDEKLKAKLYLQIDTFKVKDMNDGGMGSLHFVKGSDGHKMRTEICEKVFMDCDGVPIMVYLDLDEDDDLFELDIWKGDYSPVVNYPECGNEIITRLSTPPPAFSLPQGN